MCGYKRLKAKNLNNLVKAKLLLFVANFTSSNFSAQFFY